MLPVLAVLLAAAPAPAVPPAAPAPQTADGGRQVPRPGALRVAVLPGAMPGLRRGEREALCRAVFLASLHSVGASVAPAETARGALAPGTKEGLTSPEEAFQAAEALGARVVLAISAHPLPGGLLRTTLHLFDPRARHERSLRLALPRADAARALPPLVLELLAPSLADGDRLLDPDMTLTPAFASLDPEDAPADDHEARRPR